ncbi:helix-turn-helix domain-containing protein [Streptomyces violascens]|uniref:helix-turn-helix domain-containing protein n=1 Tax=Streptomyces violascens TaxID=67381 RepID=UPI0036686F9D
MLEQPGFGRRLRQLRQQQGKSQVDLTGPGMSATYLSRLESGGRRPTERAVAYLADQLGVAVDAFKEQPEDSLADVVATGVLSEGKPDAEMGRRLSDAMKASGEVDPMTRWHGLAQLARNHEALGDFPEQLEALRELVSLSDDVHRPVLQVKARLEMARCARGLGHADAARQAVREALALSDQHHLEISTADQVRSRLVLASAEAELGDLGEAARLSEEACASLVRKDGVLAAEAFWTAATVSTWQGNHTRAFALLLEALAAIDSRDDLKLWIRLRLAAAALSLQAAPPRLTEAQTFLESVEPALKLTGPPRHIQEMLFLQARLAYHQGDLDRAKELADQVEADLELLSYRDQIRFEVLQGLLAIRSGAPNAAATLRELANRVQSANMPDLAVEVWRAVAEGVLLKSAE